MESLNTQSRPTLENDACLDPDNNETNKNDNVENVSNELEKDVGQSDSASKGQELESKGENRFGSVTSLRSKKSLAGSVTSLRSESKKSVTGSQISVRTLQGDSTGSKVELRSGDDLGSKVSLSSKKSTRGSQISVKQTTEGSRVSLRSIQKENMGSKTSLRSFKEVEKTTLERGILLLLPYLNVTSSAYLAFYCLAPNIQ